MFLRLSISLLSIVLASLSASADIQTQPTEVISASPLTPFSERAGLWPVQEIQAEGAANFPVRATSDFFNSNPGVQARQEGSPTLSIRGSAQADRVLKLFEGIPLNLADGIGASDLFLPKESIGTLRLIKGPASVFYGGSAMSGAVDHQQRLFDKPAVRFSIADDSGLPGMASLFGVAPTRAGQFTVFGETAPNRIAYDSVSGYGSGRRDHNSTETLRTTAISDFKIGAKTRVKPILLLAQAKGKTPGSLSHPSLNTFDRIGSLAGVDVSYPLGESDELAFRISDVRQWGTYDRGTTSESGSTTTRTALTADTRTRVFGRTLMRTFADLKWDSVISSGFFSDSSHNASTFEVGQSYEIPLGIVLNLQPAYRYRPATGDFTKAVGLVRADNAHRTWLTYSEGFRPPSLSDRFATMSTFKGNPDLQPERSRSAEAGVSLENGRRYGGFLDGFAFEGSAYHTLYDNLFDTRSLGGNVTQKINTGRAHASGFEAQVGYGRSIWNFGAGYGHLDAKNDDNGETLRLSPKHQVVLTAGAQLGPALFEVTNTHWSPYYDRTTSGALQQMPGWSTFDFGVRTIGLNSWEIRAGVFNLFDVPRELTVAYPEPQRRLYASALRYF
jgi:outer membrane receptor protein involved in Fe transport